MSRLQQRYEILSSSKVGIEFEFFTELSPKETVKSLTRHLGKKVVIPVEITGLNTTEKGTYHSDIEPTPTLFKLERDFSGGKEMYELITGAMPYEEARIIIIKMLQWIKFNGWSDDKSAIHLNISFNQFKARLRTPLMGLNVLKFCLGFDEEYIYERFPNRRDSVYAKSIYNIYPLNRFVFYDSPEQIDKNEYIVPNEKYYGVNFLKLPKDYIEIRYLGGRGYENKTYKILEILEYTVLKLYSTLQQGDSYTPEEKDKLYKILREQKKVAQTFSDPEKFLLTYPNIQITVDMKGNFEVIKAYWTSIREPLFSLISDSGLKSGHFNLDTDFSAIQVRNGSMKKANHIKSMELFDCDVSGTISDCLLFRCTVMTSRLNSCKLLDSNVVTNSKVECTSIEKGNVLNNCYIKNDAENINGIINGGVIRKGLIGLDAEISPQTLIVDAGGRGKSGSADDKTGMIGGDKKDVESLSGAFSKKNTEK
jgi:hypothetical protein